MNRSVLWTTQRLVKRVLLKRMKDYTIDDLKGQFVLKNYHWPDGVHIVGVRALNEIDNVFCDKLYCFNYSTLVVSGIGTTVPGRPYLLKPINVKGTAILKEGQCVDCWKVGLHNGYNALIQCAPITVYRDANRDSILNRTPGTEDTGIFNIDIHHAGQNFVAKFIDNFSAGCQVWDNINDFNKMLNAAVASEQQYFTYTLLNEF